MKPIDAAAIVESADVLAAAVMEPIDVAAAVI
jgi:hypothetical protein